MHVTYNGIGTALAVRSAGGLLTNILCGIFQKFVKNYPDLMLTISFFLPAMRMPEQIFFFFKSYKQYVYVLCSFVYDTIYQFIDTYEYCIFYPRCLREFG